MCHLAEGPAPLVRVVALMHPPTDASEGAAHHSAVQVVDPVYGVVFPGHSDAGEHVTSAICNMFIYAVPQRPAYTDNDRKLPGCFQNPFPNFFIFDVFNMASGKKSLLDFMRKRK